MKCPLYPNPTRRSETMLSDWLSVKEMWRAGGGRSALNDLLRRAQEVLGGIQWKHQPGAATRQRQERLWCSLIAHCCATQSVPLGSTGGTVLRRLLKVLSQQSVTSGSFPRGDCLEGRQRRCAVTTRTQSGTALKIAPGYQRKLWQSLMSLHPPPRLIDAGMRGIHDNNSRQQQ